MTKNIVLPVLSALIIIVLVGFCGMIYDMKGQVKDLHQKVEGQAALIDSIQRVKEPEMKFDLDEVEAVPVIPHKIEKPAPLFRPTDYK